MLVLAVVRMPQAHEEDVAWQCWKGTRDVLRLEVWKGRNRTQSATGSSLDGRV